MPAKKPKTKAPGSLLLSRRRPGGAAGLLGVVGGGGRIEKATTANPASLSSKAGRKTIRLHHTLQKKLSQARVCGDAAAAEALQAEIDANGGLEMYQRASVSGQSEDRGGDSSKTLMQWLREAGGLGPGAKSRGGGGGGGGGGSDGLTDTSARDIAKETNSNISGDDRHTGGRYRVLEVGCLSPNNAVSKSPFLDVTRIDLQSRHPSIESQDFMERPLPSGLDEQFDLLSLSLVLNYVPLPAARGDMLRRTTLFLRDTASHPLFPALFLVLPAPCVDNSRYLDEARLEAIMASLGYERKLVKKTAKLYYSLWRLRGVGAAAAAAAAAGGGGQAAARSTTASKHGTKTATFKKQEVRPGKTRNNFAVVLE